MPSFISLGVVLVPYLINSFDHRRDELFSLHERNEEDSNRHERGLKTSNVLQEDQNIVYLPLISLVKFILLDSYFNQGLRLSFHHTKALSVLDGIEVNELILAIVDVTVLQLGLCFLEVEVKSAL